MALIPILGVPSTFRVPGQFAEVLFAQGPASVSAGARDVMFVMPMLSTGTWTANTVYRVNNENEVVDGAGAGSPLHRAIRLFLRSNNTAKVWALPYAESSGAGVATADLDFTYATDPTATGVTTVTIAGEQITVSFTSNDTVTDIADDVSAAVNAREHLPVTAANVAGVVTLTAKIAGQSQGDGTTGAIRVHVEIDSGVGTTVTTENTASDDFLGNGTATAGADGATTEAANLQSALDTITAARYYYMVFSVWDATGLGNAVTHISSKSEPIPGLRSVGIAAYTGTLANAQTLATGRNYERLQIVWQPNSEHDPAELAANMAGIRQKWESVDSAYNFDTYRASTDWFIKPAFLQSDWPDLTDQNDAINDGLAVLASDQIGSFVVMSVDTRSKNEAGTVDDFRATETHRISVADEYTDTLLLNHQLNFQNKKLASDQLLDDGVTVDPNQLIRDGVITPEIYKPYIKSLLDDFFAAAKLQNVETSKQGLRVVRDPNNGGRLEVGHDLHVIDHLHQATFRLAEVSTG